MHGASNQSIWKSLREACGHDDDENGCLILFQAISTEQILIKSKEWFRVRWIFGWNVTVNFTIISILLLAQNVKTTFLLFIRTHKTKCGVFSTLINIFLLRLGSFIAIYAWNHINSRKSIFNFDLRAAESQFSWNWVSDQNGTYYRL